MSLFFSCQSLAKSYGSDLLFRDLSLSLFAGDRLGLIGPNGSGKSTLLKIIAGIEELDEGTLSFKKGLSIGYVAQEEIYPDLPPMHIVLEEAPSEHAAKTWLSKLGFTGEEPSANTLSGGWKKRLSIALALMKHPDVLLLDEPTNHLDLEGVIWLEQFLLREVRTCIVVSHDRSFLQKLTNRTFEVNAIYPEGFFSTKGSFEHFLSHRRLFLEGQLQKERAYGSKARREKEWLSKSPQARTTKAEARIQDANEVIEAHADLKRRNREQRVDLQFKATERQTRKLLVAKNVKVRSLFEHVDLTLSPGVRLGLIGPNGSGKTTFLRLLAGEITPCQGTLKSADDLRIVYFDQHRSQLPLDLTLKEALSPNGDYVTYQGQSIHVNGWCKRFLFSPDSLEMPLHKLSGGERARITLAHLILQPADLLLLDEPTNDLDIPTLEILEESLLNFPGAIVLISHDRTLLERTCNQFFAIKEGAFFQTLEQFEKKRSSKKTSSKEKKRALSKKKTPSYKEKKELETLEERLKEKEKSLEQMERSLSEASPEELPTLCQEIEDVQQEIERLFGRWAELSLD